MPKPVAIPPPGFDDLSIDEQIDYEIDANGCYGDGAFDWGSGVALEPV